MYLANDLRDTEGDWFYWCFKAEGAQGKTLTFTFGEHDYVSYWGAAVSRDGENWTWSGRETAKPNGFTYTFGPDDDCLIFCHDMNYPYTRFERVAKELNLPVSVLTKSEQGRDVPLVRLGEEGPALLLTSRHHCCESTGTWVIEGMLREFAENPPSTFRVLAVPFVDLDGAVNGDQGKSRKPHDHNRDYIEHPIYKSTAAIMKLAESENILWDIDLHAPAHQGHEHDYIYLLRTDINANTLRETFSELLEKETKLCPEAFPFCHRFAFDWYYPNPGSCGYFFATRPGTRLACTIESTYAGNYWRKVSAESLIAFGRCAARAIRAATTYPCLPLK